MNCVECNDVIAESALLSSCAAPCCEYCEDCAEELETCGYCEGPYNENCVGLADNACADCGTTLCGACMCTALKTASATPRTICPACADSSFSSDTATDLIAKCGANQPMLPTGAKCFERLTPAPVPMTYAASKALRRTVAGKAANHGKQAEHVIPNSCFIVGGGRTGTPVGSTPSYTEASAITYFVDDDQRAGTEHKWLTDCERKFCKVVARDSKFATLDQWLRYMEAVTAQAFLDFRTPAPPREPCTGGCACFGQAEAARVAAAEHDALKGALDAVDTAIAAGADAGKALDAAVDKAKIAKQKADTDFKRLKAKATTSAASLDDARRAADRAATAASAVVTAARRFKAAAGGPKQQRRAVFMLASSAATDRKTKTDAAKRTVSRNAARLLSQHAAGAPAMSGADPTGQLRNGMVPKSGEPTYPPTPSTVITNL